MFTIYQWCRQPSKSVGGGGQGRLINISFPKYVSGGGGGGGEVTKKISGITIPKIRRVKFAYYLQKFSV